MKRRLLNGFVMVACAAGIHPPAASETPPQPPRGVLVEDVAAGSALALAGVRPGDVLTSWERLSMPPSKRNERGELESIFDWKWLEVTQAPRGTVRLFGRRNDEAIELDVALGLWEAKVRPRMPADALQDYLTGKEHVEAGRIRQGIRSWKTIAEVARERNDWVLRCWISLRAGDLWREAQHWDEAHAEYENALLEARNPMSRVTVLEKIGDSFRDQNDYENAEARYRLALELNEATWGESLPVARTAIKLGNLAFSLRQLDVAEEHCRRSLAIGEKLAPASAAVGASLNNLGNIAILRGDLEEAEARHQRALELWQELAPDGVKVASSLNNLGLIAIDRGEWEIAEERYRRALFILERLGRDDFAVATILSNLGTVAWQRGELSAAWEYQMRSLEIHAALNPDSLAAASSLNNLGALAHDRGDLEMAENYHERSLEIKEKLTPENLATAASLNSLGSVAIDRGDPETAAEYHRRALEIQREVVPGSLDVATSLNNLGAAHFQQGALDLAEQYYGQALRIWKRIVPNGTRVGLGLNNLGNVAFDRGDLDRAESYFRQALEIREELAPRSKWIADSLHGLGRVAYRRGDPELAARYHEKELETWQEAAPGSQWEADALQILGRLAREAGRPEQAAGYFARSMEALEAQISKLGGTQESKGRFRARKSGIYDDAIRFQIESNRPEDSFHTLERSRGQSFLALLAERDLVFSADIPEALGKSRRRLAVRSDRIQRQLTELDPARDRERIEGLMEELENVRRERDELIVEIRRASPRLAAVQYPRPLTFREARAALDPGTVMLSYHVGEERTDLYVVARDRPLEVRSLAVGEGELEERVQLLHRLSTYDQGSHRTAAGRRALGEWLYRALVEPAAPSIRRGDRLLIVPDGPLHRLPFAALVRETGDDSGATGRSWQYLVEWRPVHSVLSATVYAQLQAGRGRPGRPSADDSRTVRLVAFGNPRYPRTDVLSKTPAGDSGFRLRGALERGLFDFRPLPHSRREVEQIAGLYGAGAARVYLGEDATEERAKSVDKTARILHFATHAAVDDRFPLNSALALTIPDELTDDRDNGLLQVWEIFERVRIDADLVVLSACESALGEPLDGEGLIGLTRAFQYAGARTVAATLWSVPDRATAELMTRFYRHLRAGRPKDEALRAAQLELIGGPIRIEDQGGEIVEMDASAPYFWAAFQLIGDWR